MPRIAKIFVGLFLSFALITLSAQAGDKSGKTPTKAKVVRIGAVAYSPSAVTIFTGIKKYLNKNDFPTDYVLYSNYDALTEALVRGEIDIAWNTPLAHAQCHKQFGGLSQTLVMRDVDRNFHSVLVVRTESGIKSIADLQGKTLVLGSNDSAEATVLPVHYLKKKGVDFTKFKVLSLDREVDFKGNPCCSPQHVLKALLEKRADAGIINENLWKSYCKNRKPGDASLELLWTTPGFNHCVFTASPKFDPKLGQRFTELMLAMSATDPNTSEIMRLEGTKQWLPGTQKGFEDLIEAISKGK